MDSESTEPIQKRVDLESKPVKDEFLPSLRYIRNDSKGNSRLSTLGDFLQLGSVSDTLVRQAVMVLKYIMLMYYKNSKGRNYRKQVRKYRLSKCQFS